MFTFTPADFEKIATALGTSVHTEGDVIRFELHHEASQRRMALELFTNLQLPSTLSSEIPNNAVRVMGPIALHQLVGCTGYVANEELGEVIFFAKRNGVTNGLVVEKEAGSSFYANVDDRLLSLDFTQLPPALMMSAVALSLTEDLFNDFS